MDSTKLPLRILYTINSSPQYILARSPSSVPVSLLHQAQNGSSSHSSTRGTRDQGLQPCYATTLLKTCLDTICRSSPELVQDISRDFSVYVLDPLESNSAPAPVNISNTTFASSSQASTSAELSNGVAVGLGLMSWALVAGESDGVTVTGTLVKQGTAHEALEVIFALRETAAMQKANLAAALKSWGTLPTSTSKQSEVPTFHSLRQTSLSSKQPTSTVASTSIPPSDLQLFQSIGPLSNPSITSQSVPKLSAPSTSVPSASAKVSAPSVPASLSIHSRRKPPKSKKSTKPASSPSSEADKIMLAEETYIGPRRKKGRPAKCSGTIEGSEGQSGSSSRPAHIDKDVVILDDTRTRENSTAPDLTGRFNQLGYSSKSGAANNGSAQDSVIPPFVTTETPRLECQSSMTLLDILAYLSASSSSRDPNVQNAALLAALNAIDSTASGSGSGSDKTSNPVLVNALKDLISAVSKPLSPPRARDGQISRPHIDDHRRNVAQDDEIVLLDKENINPTAFRRRAERDKTKNVPDAELPASVGGLSASSLGSPPSPVNFDGTSHNRNFSARLNAHPVPATMPTSPSPAGRRKRTLSDFMDDRDSRMNSGFHRHPHSATKRTSSMNASISGLRHYPRLLLCDQLQRHDRTGSNSYYQTGTEFWSSPPRSKSEDHTTTHSRSEHKAENSQLNVIDTSDSPQSLRVSASSPARAQPRPRKRYVVPTWARTETSTQPRLSQAAQQSLAEAEDNEGGKKKKSHRGEREKKRRVKSAAFSSSSSQNDTAAHLEDSTTSATLPVLPLPVASSSDCPVFAVTSVESTIPALLKSTADSRSPGPFPSKSNISIPRTPPRRRISHVHTPGTGNSSGSLFTPASSRAANDRNLTGSPFFSPQGLFSPISSKTINTASSSGTPAIGNFTDRPITPSADISKESNNPEDALHQELEDALKEIGQSCNPLSDSGGGDIDQNEDFSSTSGGSPTIGPQSEASENREDVTVNELWAGLPPSSPPPMSSPLLIPDVCSDDEDMDELDLPVATSDAEDCATDLEAMPPSSAVPDLSTCSDQEFAEYLSDNDFSALFAAVNQSSVADHEAEFDVDIFNQFTTLNAQSDGSYGDQNSDMDVDAGLMQSRTGLADFDFTEFWETFKPLVQDRTVLGNTDAHPEFVQYGDAHSPRMMENVDHTKLAEDVQTLLSGCLV